MPFPKPVGRSEILPDSLFEELTGSSSGADTITYENTTTTIIEASGGGIVDVRLVVDDQTATDGSVSNIQGISLAAGDVVLLRGQTNAAHNGPYIVALGTAWGRLSSDAADWRTLRCLEGTHAGAFYTLRTVGGIVVGTTLLTFEPIQGDPRDESVSDAKISGSMLSSLTTAVKTTFAGAINWLHALITTETTDRQTADSTITDNLNSHAAAIAGATLGHIRDGGDLTIDPITGKATVRDGQITVSKIDNMNAAGSGQVLSYDASGRMKWISITSGIAGSGTANRVPYWSNSGTLADSRIRINGTLGKVEFPFVAGDTLPSAYFGDETSAANFRVGGKGGSYGGYGLEAVSWTNHAMYAESKAANRSSIYAYNQTGTGCTGRTQGGGAGVHALQDTGATSGEALRIEGAERRIPRLVTGPHTGAILATDNEIHVDTRTGAVTLTLPASANHRGKRFRIIDIGMQAGTTGKGIIINCSAGESFWDGLASKTIQISGDGYEILVLTNPITTTHTFAAHKLARV